VKRMIRNQATMERILIVDDQTFVRVIISRKLTEEGYECTAVSDGDTALALLKECQFALVLLDIAMPGKSGIDILRQIVVRHPDTAAIMVTARNSAETAIEAMKIGAYDYIIKPVNLTELPLRVRRALEKRQLMIENDEYKSSLENKVQQQTKKIRETFLNSIQSLALALEAKDKYTGGHSQRVANLAVDIARELGMAPEYLEKLKFAALVHDIGKIGIKESIINKKESLTDEEYSYIATHAVIGQKILTPVIEDTEILKMVRHHHERYDGKGYPDGISAGQIPLGARIIAVADTYDAMTSDRPYRKAVSHEIAVVELKRQTLVQFDPEIVDAFITMMNKRQAALSTGYQSISDRPS
jgi:putative two-component system response regulator